MEKSKFLYGALGLLALGLSSCSSDDLVVETPKVESDETRFITVSISAPSEIVGSRAETPYFEDGTAAESKVVRLDFIFYDVNGNPTAKRAPITPSATGGEITFTPEGTTSDNVTSIYTSVIPVELTQGQNLPAQVICIVNGDEGAVGTLQSKSLSELSDITQTNFSRVGNFLMTNSVYYGLDIHGNPNMRLCATPINANTQLFKTREEAQTALTAAATGTLVEIYVERVAAKVGLTLNPANIEAYTLVNGAGTGEDDATVSLKFVPEYWLMNATDKECYLTKRYGVSTTNMNPTYSEINQVLDTDGGWKGWNSPENHRSYWGTSPSYFKSNFPLTSDQVTSDMSVTYYTYNTLKSHLSAEGSAISKQGRAAEETAGGVTPTYEGGWSNSYIYTRETTTPASVINDIDGKGNPAAAVASAVVLGHYNVGAATSGVTFYVDRNEGTIQVNVPDPANPESTIKEDRTVGTYYPYTATNDATNKALMKFIGRQSIVFSDDEGTTPLITPGFYKIDHPDKDVRGNLANPNIAGRLVTLQLSAAPNIGGNPAYYYDATSGKYKEITKDNLPVVNAQLVSVGYMEKFGDGLGFYSVPIRHLNWKSTSYADGEYKWKTMKVGELGVVRNHVYNLTINKIAGLANALPSPDDPIVPAKDAVNQYIAMKLNILSWNVACEWSVDL